MQRGEEEEALKFETREDLEHILIIEGLASGVEPMEIEETLDMIGEDIGDPSTLPTIPYLTTPVSVGPGTPGFVRATQVNVASPQLSVDVLYGIGDVLRERREYETLKSLHQVTGAVTAHDRLRYRLLLENPHPVEERPSLAMLKSRRLEKELIAWSTSLTFSVDRYNIELAYIVNIKEKNEYIKTFDLVWHNDQTRYLWHNCRRICPIKSITIGEADVVLSDRWNEIKVSIAPDIPSSEHQKIREKTIALIKDILSRIFPETLGQ